MISSPTQENLAGIEIKKIIRLSNNYRKQFLVWHQNMPSDYIGENNPKYEDVKILTDKNVIEPAKIFTDKFLEFAEEKPNFFSKLIAILSQYNTPYTQEKPNFAINMSILINYNYYEKKFGEVFLKNLLMSMEEDAFTGIFQSKQENNDRKIEFLYNYIIPMFNPLKLHNKYTISNSNTTFAIEDRLKKSNIQRHRETRRKTRRNSTAPYVRGRGIISKKAKTHKKQKHNTPKQQKTKKTNKQKNKTAKR
jgi:hypothetical protein